jgi:metallophosphoesterase (TIGR00282 family)
MNILFIGDIVGKSGRTTVYRVLDDLVREHNIDFIIANAENIAHGKGVTLKLYNELIDHGIDVVTLGNHAFAKSEIMENLDQCDRLVRPMNLYPVEPGQAFVDVKKGQFCVRVVNLCGSVFMDNVSEPPFNVMNKVLAQTDPCILIVDLHAEATSEKLAFAHLFKDRCTAIIGTHTHVQTADEQVMNGCAYISDVGMSGPFDSIIGRDTQEVLDRFTGKNTKGYTVSENPSQVCAVVIEVDDSTLRANSITRIQLRPNHLVKT